MDLGHYWQYERQPERIVSSIRRQVFKVLLYEDRGDESLKAKHLTELERLMDHFRVGLCGNYYLEPVKESPDDFRLEREFTAQHMFGYFVFNMDRYGSANLCHNYVKVWAHMMARYAYRTRRPLVEKLENRNRVIFARLLNILETAPMVACFAAEMLCCCCQYKSLALRLVDFHHADDDGPAAYVRLLRSVAVGNLTQLAHLVAIFKFLGALLLTHVEVARYAFNRDAAVLVDAFNGLLRLPYYVRMRGLGLFGRLLQNRYLAKLIGSYTSNVANYQLLMNAMQLADQHGRKAELVKLFEMVRLFVLNPANEQPGPMRQQLLADYQPLYQTVEKVQRIRSYTDIALFRPEYANVLERLNKLANKIESSAAAATRSGLQMPSTSDDEL